MIKLEYFNPSDFKQLIHWINSPEFLIQWSGSVFNFPLDKDQLERYIEKANKENSDTFVYKAINETGDVIGHISLGQIDRKNKSARVGKVLIGEDQSRGKGIGQLIVNAALEIAFKKFDLQRVSLGVFDFNKQAILCYERSGFIKEGLLRNSIKVENKFWSVWIMSILRDEWLNKN
ncbi:GNAT family protein [Lysinibacillus sp. FSL P2-0066]|uniref:GNAT family N-acetyltransferase n=1 Tax=Lysinibacillus sp. FSL P2-0066 TaxID=2921720 RepID=UPI0030D730A4